MGILDAIKKLLGIKRKKKRPVSGSAAAEMAPVQVPETPQPVPPAPPEVPVTLPPVTAPPVITPPVITSPPAPTVGTEVTSAAELRDAVVAAKPGASIILGAGNYGEQVFYGLQFDPAICITGQAGAVIERLTANACTGLTFDGIALTAVAKPGEPKWTRTASFGKCKNITIKNCKFTGQVAQGTATKDDGFGTGFSFAADDCTNVLVENSAFATFNRGPQFRGTSGVRVIGNDISDISEDGMDFVMCTDVRISQNKVHDFRRHAASPAHPDMIQFYTQGTNRPSTGVTIEDNTFDIGDGEWAQTIFMRNEEVDQGRAGMEMYYRDVVIRNNTIRNNHTHGITVGETTGLVVDRNTVVPARTKEQMNNASTWRPQINLTARSLNVAVTDNIAMLGEPTTPPAGWDVRGNQFP